MRRNFRRIYFLIFAAYSPSIRIRPRGESLKVYASRLDGFSIAHHAYTRAQYLQARRTLIPLLRTVLGPLLCLDLRFYPQVPSHVVHVIAPSFVSPPPAVHFIKLRHISLNRFFFFFYVAFSSFMLRYILLGQMWGYGDRGRGTRDTRVTRGERIRGSGRYTRGEIEAFCSKETRKRT